MSNLARDLYVFTKAKEKLTIKYVYNEKLIFNNHKATRILYNQPRVVFKNLREDYTKSKAKTRRDDSVSRSRQKIYDIVDSNIREFSYMPVFATFTFKENVTNIRTANGYFRNFIRRLSNQYDHKLAYLTVVEFQKRGAIHYHTIFFNLPFIHMLKFEKIWSYGTTNINGIRKVKDVASYVCKYLTKETLDNRLVGEKVYFTSRGLKRSEVSFDNFEIAERLNNYPLLVEDKTYTHIKIQKYAK